MKFLIITHVIHKKQANQYFAYSPYVREMNIWAKQADEFIIVAPLETTAITPIDTCYEQKNIRFVPINAVSLLGAKALFSTFFKLPKISWSIFKAMRQADHIHLRCPGNMGLLGCLVQLLFPHKPKTAKYAGNWDPKAQQPWSYRLQKWILNHTFLTRNMQVLVYGKWEGSSKNIKPFFTATYSETDKIPLQSLDLKGKIRFVFVGTLSKGKNALYAIQLIEKLYQKGQDVALDLYGEGIERKNLEEYIASNQLGNLIQLKGNQSQESVTKAYQNSHFVLLPSQSEGWPKAIAEGMFWGCVPVATPVSCVPFMLDYGERGILLQMQLEQDAQQLQAMLTNKTDFETKRQKASHWSRKYTLEVFEKEIKEMVTYSKSPRNKMRILQLIDSLDAGGAERVAVHYANALACKIAFSGLVATRKEGDLVHQLDSRVSYLFLNKKKTIDFRAVLRLRTFVIQHQVTHIHAHSTSFFLAFLVKLSRPSTQLIWHDHYGNNEFLATRPHFVLKRITSFFSGIIAVNQTLKNWSEQKLKAKNVIYLPNFIFDTTEKPNSTTPLHGEKGKRIVLLANLRSQKNHFLALEVAQKIKQSHPEWTFHLVGKDFEDAYSQKIKEKIKASELENQVFLYGSRSDVTSILQQSTIGILTSISEGLPVAVLEYGMQKLPVVVTAVGELPAIIRHKINGMLVPSNQTEDFYAALVHLIENESERNKLGDALYQTIDQEYTAKSVICQYLRWLEGGKL